MGSSVSASCSCGYSADAMIGGGMLSFHNTCLFPAICNECDEIVEVNLMAESLACGTCDSENVQPYTKDDLKGEPGSTSVVEWNYERDGFPTLLTDGTYLCPRCGDFGLRFQHGGMNWD